MSISGIRCFLVNTLSQSLRDRGFKIVKPTEIPVNWIHKTQQVCYGSAIALKLAQVESQNAMEIATQIVKAWPVNLDSASHFRLKVLPPGMIQFQLTDQGLAVWLQKFSQMPPSESAFVKFDTVYQTFFAIQYSHARCCSLLRLADRDRIITLHSSSRETTPTIFSLLTPNPIPWCDQGGNLRLVHIAERQLISQLLTTLDARCNCGRQPQWDKLANRLSQAFQDFYAQCRIWGEVKRDTPELAQARLGLILITQSILRFMLQEKLGAIAPPEL